MAIYNPKRARELEAAARLAEAQRQRELAKGQREQRTTEQILGLVEGLIGAAPQVAGAFEQSQAERVLAGDRPLEMPEAKDPLESLGRFLFEPGIQRRAKAMAQERAPAELAKLQPLTTQAVTQRLAAGDRPLDMPSERKQITREEYEKRLGQAMPVEASARGVLEQSPALSMLPEREQQALAVGETQRVQAEQAAAERQARMDEAKLAEMAAKATKAAGGELPDRKDLRQAAELTTIANASNLEGEINAVGDPTLTGQTFEKVKQLAEQSYAARGGDPSTNEGMADVSSIVAATYKKYRKKDFSPKDYDQVQEALNLNYELNGLNDLRSKVSFEPTQAQQIRQRIAETETILNLDEIMKAANDLQVLGELTSDQVVYLRLAAQAKNSLIKAANDGYNVTNSDFGRLSSIVLDPMAPQEVWDGLLTGTLRNINSSAKQRFDVISSTVTAPASLRARMMELEIPEVALTGGKDKVLKDVPGDIGEVFSNLFTLLGQAGLSATGIDDAINMASNSDNPTLKGAADAAKTVLDMFMGMSKKTDSAAPAAPQTSQQQIQQMQKLPGSELAPTAPAPPGQVHIKITLPNGMVRYDTDTLDRAAKMKEMGKKTGIQVGFIQDVGAGR